MVWQVDCDWIIYGNALKFKFLVNNCTTTVSEKGVNSEPKGENLKIMAKVCMSIKRVSGESFWTSDFLIFYFFIVTCIDFFYYSFKVLVFIQVY